MWKIRIHPTVQFYYFGGFSFPLSGWYHANDLSYLTAVSAAFGKT